MKSELLQLNPRGEAVKLVQEMMPLSGSEISLLINRGCRDSSAVWEPIMNTSWGDW